MQKLYCLFIALLVAMQLHAQAAKQVVNQTVEREQTKIRLRIPSFAIRVASWVAPELRPYTKGIRNIKLAVFENTNNTLERYQRERGRINTKKYKAFVTVHSGDEHIEVFCKKTKRGIRGVWVLVGTPDEFVSVRVRGNIDIKRLLELSKKSNVSDKLKLDKKSELPALPQA